MSDIKKMYKTIMADNFPPEMTITFGDQKLVYRKRSWKLDEGTGELIEKGLRYGENPDQQAAMYQLVSGNLCLAGVEVHRAGERSGERHHRGADAPGGQASGQDELYGPRQRAQYPEVS